MSYVATSSPASSNKIGETIIAISAINGSTPQQKPGFFEIPKQSLRGLNKPKCIKCGNAARSRASWRLNALKQQSVHLSNSLRTKKPLTRKDALSINSRRFMKLREYILGNIDAEIEAFERYTTNISLLKEAFSIAEGFYSDTHSTAETIYSEDKKQKLVTEIKIKLTANVERADGYRKMMRDRINQKLIRLQEKENVTNDDLDGDDESDNCRELKRLRKAVRLRSDRNLAVNDLIEKLSRAHNEDDLRSCLDLKLQLSKQIVCVTGTSNDTGTYSDLISKPSISKKEPENAIMEFSSSDMEWKVKVWKAVHVDHDAVSSINMEFSSSNQIAEL